MTRVARSPAARAGRRDREPHPPYAAAARFTHRHFQWLVDVDAAARAGPGRPGGWPASTPRDHLDGARLGGGIRGDVDRFLARRGVHLDRADRVLMLAHARVLGHTFDPLSVFWCLSPGRRRCGRSSSRCTTPTASATPTCSTSTTTGRADSDKAFYVSPFNDVSGRYDVRLRLTPDRVSVTVGLDRDGERVLTATTTGTPVRATYRTLASTTARHLLMTQRVSLLIRWHGIRLWLRRLPVHPDRPTPLEESVR